MSKRPKRTDLSGVFGQPETAIQETAESPTPSEPTKSPGKRPQVKQQTVYLPLAVYEQLRTLAFEERRKMHSYLMEGLDRVFENRGLPSSEELDNKQ